MRDPGGDLIAGLTIWAVLIVVLDAETVPGVDVTAAEMLANLHAAGVELLIAGDIGRVRDVLDRSGDVSLPAYPDVESALAALERGDHR